jgi:integrase
MRDQQKLPKFVSLHKAGYRYKPYLGRVDGRIKWGKSCYIALPDATMSEVWRAYEELQSGPRNTVRWLLALYVDSQKFTGLKEKTRGDYMKAIDTINAADIGGGTFGDADLERVTKRTIRSYLDTYPAPIAANRHIAVLKSAWSWAEERHEIPENPCLGVKMNEEKPRDRYVTDEEYLAVLRMAPPELQQMMELAYLLRARLSEVTGLTTADVSDTHVTLDRLKGSEGELTMLSERLRDALSDVRGEPYVTYRYTESAFRSAWRRLQGKMDKAGIERFTFHDLKAKGISDHKDNFGGHRSPNMRKVYVRKLQEVEATC